MNPPDFSEPLNDWTDTADLLNRAADMIEHWPLTETTVARAQFAQELRDRATVFKNQAPK